jgi:hypothetical protein
MPMSGHSRELGYADALLAFSSAESSWDNLQWPKTGLKPCAGQNANSSAKLALKAENSL